MKNLMLKSATGVAAVLFTLSLHAQTAPLTAGDPIALTGTTGGCDFIQVDKAGNRLLLGHEGNHSFDVFDLSSRQLVKVVATGTSQDAATDKKRHAYYVSGNDPGRMVTVDSQTLAVTGQVPLPDDTDLIGYDPKTGLVHICDDKAAQQWVIDPATQKIVATITFDGKGLEDMALDTKKRRLYQAVKGTSTIAAVDLDSNKILAVWPLAPDKGPHGIALDRKMDRLLVACAANLVMLDTTTGKIVSTAPIGGRVDEMAYDPELHMAYCASRLGNISVISVAADKLTAVGNVPDAPKSGNIAVDPNTHIVWITCQKDGKCFAQPFTPAK